MNNLPAPNDHLPSDELLAVSQRLLTMLEQHADDPAVAQRLDHHRTLHVRLSQQQAATEHARAAWRTALTARWQSEIVAQRVYLATYQQFVRLYGEGTAIMNLIEPSSDPACLTSDDLERELRRLHAAISLLAPDNIALQHEVADVLARLGEANSHAATCDNARRHAATEYRFTATACQQAIDETSRRLLHVNEPLQPRPIVSSNGVGAHH